MAKKGTQVQLQAEISSDEDWEKLLEREGLIIVDVYSDWCGPCAAMSANLKKLKLEIGGDNLHLAMAKSDNIEPLKRFRDKSEPTWMFIANGKMTNLMFGANAPKLTRLIIDELKREQAVRDGTKTRVEMNILELSPEEQVRFEALERFRMEGEEVEREAKMKAKDERLKLIVNCVLQNFPNSGVFVVFPYALDRSTAVHDVWDQGLKAGTVEKQTFENINIEDMLYFTDYRFPEVVLEHAKTQGCNCYLTKTEDPEANVDSTVANAIFGASQQPPGSPESFAQKMRTVITIPPTQEDEAEREEEHDGVWVPPDPNTRALAIYMLFPKQALSYVPPEPEAIPPHIAVAFDAIKRSDVMALIEEYRKDVLRFGFFTEDKPESAKLIAKTVTHFEKKAEETTYGEKMVVQVSKKHSDTILAFAQLGPSYMSPNSVEGERECKLFFPKGYDEPEPEEVEPEVKKKGRKKGKKVAEPTAVDEEEKPKPTEEGETPFIEGEEAGEGKDFSPEMAEDDDEAETYVEFEEGEEFGVDEMPEELDKATSPMGEETSEMPTPSEVSSGKTEATETIEIAEPPPTTPQPPTAPEQEPVAEPPPAE